MTIELREHAIAYAARVLRESDATPSQTKVGIQLALGKPKPVTADELGIRLSSVADLSKKLYQTYMPDEPRQRHSQLLLLRPDRNRFGHLPGQHIPLLHHENFNDLHV